MFHECHLKCLQKNCENRERWKMTYFWGHSCLPASWFCQFVIGNSRQGCFSAGDYVVEVYKQIMCLWECSRSRGWQLQHLSTYINFQLSNISTFWSIAKHYNVFLCISHAWEMNAIWGDQKLCSTTQRGQFRGNVPLQISLLVGRGLMVVRWLLFTNASLDSRYLKIISPT